jgi:hypothetical protein
MEFKELAEAMLCGRKHNNVQYPWATQEEELADELETTFRHHVEIMGRKKQKVASSHPEPKSAPGRSDMDDTIEVKSLGINLRRMSADLERFDFSQSMECMRSQPTRSIRILYLRLPHFCKSENWSTLFSVTCSAIFSIRCQRMLTSMIPRA